MKTILKPFFYLLFLVTLSSCAQEQIGRELMISGKFAQINESGLTSLFLEFDDGQLSFWRTSDESYPFAEKRIWHCESRAFYKTTMRPYSIIDGIIVIGNYNSGKIELIDDVLHFNGETFGAMEGFIPSAYSRITVNPEEIINLTYVAESVRVPVHIENPIPGGVLSATTTAKWISDLRVEDGYLLFNTASTKENRDAVITLSYTHAENLNVTVTQAPSTFIRITDPDKTIGYETSSYSIECTIDNPIASSVLTVNCSNNWIQNLEIQDGRVNFNVTENNTGNERKAYFYFQYEGAPDVMYTLTQKWDAATIISAPTSAEHDYTGGQGSFTFEIQNPRQGTSVTAQSQASWISNVAVNGDTVTYQVAENNSGAQRTGKIKLSYGNFTTMEFSIIQSWSAPSITLSPSSQTTEYQGGSFSFVYEISNPRENTTVTATSQSSWITDVKITGTTVSYSIADNNSSAQRTGKIKLKYGSYATAEFSTTQKGKPVVSLELNKNSLALNVGERETLIATVDPSGAALTWSSDNTTVATVSQTGLVTAIGNGTATISVSAGNGIMAKCVITVVQLVKSVSLDKTSLSLNVGEEYTFSATVKPDNATDKSLKWTSSNESVATVDQAGKVTAISKGTATIETEAQDGSRKYARCSLTVRDPYSDVAPSGAVDLGLSVYWATYNIGATRPEGYGNYYAWGETKPKDNYDWSTYKWCNGSETTLTKYNISSSFGTVDNKTVLDSEDDVAHVKLGGNWRIPTYAEWEELLYNCTWTWTSNYKRTGIAGIIGTSNKAGYTDKSIFLPAAGDRVKTNLYGVGSEGRYLSSSLVRIGHMTYCARDMEFSYNDQDWVSNFLQYLTSSSPRCCGLSVRPVYE